jgi:acyl-coenzyme A synthetase/AMP-(fatty) acid ligase
MLCFPRPHDCVCMWGGAGRCTVIDVMDVKMGPELAKQRPYCSAETQDSEDPLFLLYTSGTRR